MSWKFAGIIIKGVEEEKIFSSFSNLNKTNESISLSEALKTKFKDYAVGNVDGSVFMINHILPYDSTYGKKNLSQLDQKLAALSKNTMILCFILDGVTATYGWSFFMNGQKARSKKNISGSQPVTFGNKLPEETKTANDDEEALIFELMAIFLEQPFEQLIFDDTSSLTIYKG
ncbi:MAG: hypothetical protein WD431_08820 [Cyclobacteriaceae bacterium]